jgi:hypothetical protein
MKTITLSSIDWKTLIDFVEKNLHVIAEYDTEDEEYVAVMAVFREVERQLTGGMGKGR